MLNEKLECQCGTSMLSANVECQYCIMGNWRRWRPTRLHMPAYGLHMAAQDLYMAVCGCPKVSHGCFGLTVGLHLAPQRLQWGAWAGHGAASGCSEAAIGCPWGCTWLVRGCIWLQRGRILLHRGRLQLPMQQICSICWTWLSRAGQPGFQETAQMVVARAVWGP